MNSNIIVQDNKKGFISILSGTIVAIAVTLILILLFAVIIRFTNLSENFIFPVNQVIKVISIFVGMLILLNKYKAKGFPKGLLLGFLYFILSYIIFSILQGKFTIGLNNLYDLILTALMGGIIGIIVVNVGKR